MDEYRESKLRATPWASPPSNGTLSHQALEYEISSLTAAGIEVIITTPAYHPEHLEYLENGLGAPALSDIKLDLETSINKFEKTTGLKWPLR